MSLLTSLSVVDAKIGFPAGLDVAWQGNMFGNIKIDAVQVTGDVGATLDNDSTFNVVDLGTLTEFTKVCLAFWYPIPLVRFSYFFLGLAYGRVIRVDNIGGQFDQ